MVARKTLEEAPAPTGLKLSLLWTSLMFLYLYNDFFTLFVPGTIDAMATGSLGPLGDYTDGKMSAVALVLVIPASMVSLSSILPAVHSRWLNLIVGAIYSAMAVATLIGSPFFYKMVVGFEIVAIALILRVALRWPVQEPPPSVLDRF